MSSGGQDLHWPGSAEVNKQTLTVWWVGLGWLGSAGVEWIAYYNIWSCLWRAAGARTEHVPVMPLFIRISLTGRWRKCVCVIWVQSEPSLEMRCLPIFKNTVDNSSHYIKCRVKNAEALQSLFSDTLKLTVKITHREDAKNNWDFSSSRFGFDYKEELYAGYISKAMTWI